MLADRLLVGVTVNALGSRIPSLHLSVHIQQKECVVLDPCRNVAADGFGRNGIYTKNILQNIKVPDLPVEIMFKRVREGVERETRKLQTPWDSSSLKGDFAFATSSGARPAQAAAGPSADMTLQIEREFWVSVRDSTRPEDIPLIALQLLRAMAKGDPELQSRFFAPTGFPRFSDGFVRRLVELDYGANVRELRQRLWQAVAASTGSELTWSAVEAATPAFDGSASQKQIEDISRERLERALDENNGSIEKTWRALGFSNRHVLNRLLRKHGLTVTKQHGRE